MTTWATLRTQVRDGLLKDLNAENNKYSDADMLIWAEWACTEISLTWAQLYSVALIPTGSVNQFDLPSDMVGSIERNALLTYTDSSNKTTIVPYRRLPGRTVRIGTTEAYAYWEAPSGVLTLNWTPKSAETLTLEYFRIWPAPVNDASVISLPKWLELPYCYLIAANAMNPSGVQASDIRQWATRIDSGNPEHNPLHRQHAFFIAQAYKLLGLMGAQDRENFLKNDPR